MKHPFSEGVTLEKVELCIPEHKKPSETGQLVRDVTVTLVKFHPVQGPVSLPRMMPGESRALVMVTLRNVSLVTGTKG